MLIHLHITYSCFCREISTHERNYIAYKDRNVTLWPFTKVRQPLVWRRIWGVKNITHLFHTLVFPGTFTLNTFSLSLLHSCELDKQELLSPL